MSSEVIDGRKAAERLKDWLTLEVEHLGLMGVGCSLATVRVGDDVASQSYERRLGRLAHEVGIEMRAIWRPASASQSEVQACLRDLDHDPSVSGILMFRPLPHRFSEGALWGSFGAAKDIEALHPENAGLLALGTPRYVPPTAAAVFHLLDRWLDGAGEDRRAFYHRSRIVVVGRSNNVGKPAVALACQREAPVESVDEWVSRVGRLGSHTRRADVLIVAAGVPRLIRAEHVRQGAVVLDVGFNATTDGAPTSAQFVGDVAFGEVLTRARALTPVPGGVGPVTDVWLLHNTVLAARHGAGLKLAASPPWDFVGKAT